MLLFPFDGWCFEDDFESVDYLSVMFVSFKVPVKM